MDQVTDRFRIEFDANAAVAAANTLERSLNKMNSDFTKFAAAQKKSKTPDPVGVQDIESSVRRYEGALGRLQSARNAYEKREIQINNLNKTHSNTQNQMIIRGNKLSELNDKQRASLARIETATKSVIAANKNVIETEKAVIAQNVKKLVSLNEYLSAERKQAEASTAPKTAARTAEMNKQIADAKNYDKAMASVIEKQKTQDRAEAVRINNEIDRQANGRLMAGQKQLKAQIEADRLLAAEKVKQSKINESWAIKDQKALDRSTRVLAYQTSEDFLNKNAKATNQLSAYEKQLERTTRTQHNYNSALRKMGSIFESLLLYHTMFAFFGKIRQAIGDAAELQIKIAEIATISQGDKFTGVGRIEASQFAAFNRAVSDQFNLSQLDAATATYEAVSNQVAEGAANFRFMAVAADFAKASVSTLTQSVDLLSSVLKAYNMDASQASEVAAQLFKTIELGRVKASDLHNIYGPALAIGGAIGVAPEELNAALETISVQGVKANTSLTFLRNIMIKLEKPTTEMKKLFADLGVSSGDAAIATYTFAGMLKEASKYAEEGRTEFVELYKDIRPYTGALLIEAGNRFKTFDENLKATTDGFEEYIKARDLVLATPGHQLQQEMTQLNNIFLNLGNSIGNAAINLKNLTGIDLSKVMYGAISILGLGVGGAALGGMISGGNPLVAGAGAIAGVTAGSAMTYLGLSGGKSFDELYALGVLKAQRETELEMHEIYKKQNEELEDKKEKYREIAQIQAKEVAKINDDIEMLESNYDGFFGAIEDGFKGVGDAIEDEEQKIGKLKDKLTETVAVIKDIQSLDKGYWDAYAERQIQKNFPYQQPQAYAEHAGYLYSEADRAARAGYGDTSIDLLKRSESFLSKGYQSAGQFPGMYNSRNFESAYNQIYQAQRMMLQQKAGVDVPEGRLNQVEEQMRKRLISLGEEKEAATEIKGFYNEINSILMNSNLSEDTKQKQVNTILLRINDTEGVTGRILKLERQGNEILEIKKAHHDRLLASKFKQAYVLEMMGRMEDEQKAKNDAYTNRKLSEQSMGITLSEAMQTGQMYVKAAEIVLPSSRIDFFTQGGKDQIALLNATWDSLKGRVERLKETTGDKFFEAMRSVSKGYLAYRRQLEGVEEAGLVGPGQAADMGVTLDKIKSEISSYGAAARIKIDIDKKAADTTWDLANAQNAYKAALQTTYGGNTPYVPAASGYASGGRVSTDTVPAMLTPGEYVVSAHAARRNLGLLNSINSGGVGLSRYGRQGYASGGIVSSVTNNNSISLNSSGSETIDARNLISALNRAQNRSVATLRSPSVIYQ